MHRAAVARCTGKGSARPTAALLSPPDEVTVDFPLQRGWQKDPRFWIATSSAIMIVLVLVVQTVGLVYATSTLKSSELPEVEWCSTLFQPFGIAIVDGNCDIRYIEQNDHRGIGCVKLPGLRQQSWIKATIGVIIMELLVELVDLIIMYHVDVTTKWREVKMKRLWAFIISGIVVLLATLIMGIQYANSLPPKITERVMVLPNVTGPSSYSVRLHSAGLRGNIIGWSDGLLESWGDTYFGA